jgi:archaellin
MPYRLTVSTATGQEYIDVADNTLVATDCSTFVLPQYAEYVVLTNGTTTSQFTPFTPAQVPTTLSTDDYQVLMVLSGESITTIQYPNANLVTAPEPTPPEGQIYCYGNELTFVPVVVVPVTSS